MKTIQKLACLSLLIILSSCQLDDVALEAPDPSADYRSKYCGEFAFFSYGFDRNMGQTSFSDTVHFVSAIGKIQGNDSLIIIRYRPGLNQVNCHSDSAWGSFVKPTIYYDGLMTYPVVICSNQSYFRGQFHGLDSLEISIQSGGLGFQYGQEIRGVRVQ